jgi:Protein of unknown function (Porph_ging).
MYQNKSTLSFAFILCFLTFNISAQVKGTINYKLTKNDGVSSATEINSIVYFSGNKSIEINLPKNLSNTIVADGDNSFVETKVLKNSKPIFVYKDFSKNELQLSDFIERNIYLIKDTLANFKWTITKEKKKILSYSCTRATTNFRGRQFEVWFTDAISVPNGPWKFCGLPGLIIVAKDLEGKYNYELTGINLKAVFDPKIISIPFSYSKEKAVSHAYFIAAYKKRVAQNAALSRASEQQNSSGGSSSFTVTLPPKMEKL